MIYHHQQFLEPESRLQWNLPRKKKVRNVTVFACPGEVLRSQLRAWAEPCRVCSVSRHYCHRADCVAFGFVLLFRSALICFGCDRHGQLPCLLSALSDNLCKRKSHWTPLCLQLPSLTGEKDLEKTKSRDETSSSGVPQLSKENEKGLQMGS